MLSQRFLRSSTAIFTGRRTIRRRLVALAAVLLTVSACRVDATVDVVMRANGSGTVAVTLVADADLVSKAPGLADDLRFDDATAAGWVIDGPTATDSGGLTVSIAHDFATPEQATALLASINGPDGPLHDVALSRTVTDDAVTSVLSGTMRVDGGMSAFADPDLLAAIGGTPYASAVADASLRPVDVIGITLRVSVPGDVSSTTGTVDADALVWTVPVDATPITLAITASESRGGSNVWSIIATVALVMLVVWCAIAIGFIVFVMLARRRRAARRASRAM